MTPEETDPRVSMIAGRASLSSETHPEDAAELESEGVGASQRQYASLDEALRAHRIPLENYDMVRRIANGIGSSTFFGTSGYIRAPRDSGGPDIRISYGYTNGFGSAEEAGQVLGADIELWRSARRGLWGVTHPVNNTRGRGDRMQRKERLDGGACGSCGNRLPRSGLCDFCS